jgi:sulfite reductase beta subunit-like hemoprotein
MIEVDAEFLSKFMGKYSLGKDDGKGSSHFLRIKIPGGMTNWKDLKKIAELSDNYGKGYAEITDRQNIQLHWINPDEAIEIFEELYKMGYTTDLCGQAFRETCHGDVRNIVACPLMGKSYPSFFNLINKINSYFSGNPDYIVLPHKFKIAVTSCGEDCVKIHANDLSLFWNGSGFIPFVGGGMGGSLPGIRYAESLNILVPEKEAFDFVRAVVDIHRDCSETDSKAKARFKYLLHKRGKEWLMKELEMRTGSSYSVETIGLEGTAVEHEGGIQDNGKHYLTLPILGGILDSEKLRLVADLSKSYGSGEVRLTTWQNIIFTDVEDFERLKRELKECFDLNIPYRAVACSSDFCGKTRFHSKDLLSQLVKYSNESIAISGCLNGCACHPLATFGFMGKLRNGKQVYDMFYKGKILYRDIRPEKIPLILKEVYHEVKD